MSLIDCYYIYLLGIGTDTDIHVCMSYVFQYLQSMIMHMPQEYRHLILPDTYYFDVSILPERGLIQNYILTKKTYGHKYYVAASIGFEEKSYPFIRKMK